MADSDLRIPSREDIRKVLDEDDGPPPGVRRHHDDGAAPTSPPQTDPEDIPHA